MLCSIAVQPYGVVLDWRVNLQKNAFAWNLVKCLYLDINVMFSGPPSHEAGEFGWRIKHSKNKLFL